MHQFARRCSIFALVFAVVAFVGGSLPLWAQDSGDSSANEKITIEPYTGPPIFLDEPESQPDATFVAKVVDSSKYANGQVRYEREISKYSDNRLVAEGFFREFYPSGEKFAEGQYLKGRQDGEWTYWHDGGKVARKVNYSDGQPDGSWEIYRADGTLSAKRGYKNGKRDGTWVVYDKSGKQPTREEAYDEGTPDGQWKVWFPNGQMQTQMGFKQGMRDGPTTIWDDKGVKRAEVAYQDNLLEGTATLWGADGTKVIQQYEKGKLIDERKENQ